MARSVDRLIDARSLFTSNSKNKKLETIAKYGKVSSNFVSPFVNRSLSLSRCCTSETFLWIMCPDASVWSCPSVFARPHTYGPDIHSYEYTALGLLWECFDPTNYCQGSPCLGSLSIRSVNSFRNLMGYECIDLSTSLM